MEFNEKNTSSVPKRSSLTVILKIASLVVALIGVALLINNILLYTSTVSQYVAQGYSKATVAKQLIPNQLIPGVLESIGMYGGIAFILYSASRLYEKLEDLTGISASAETNGEIETPDENKETEGNDGGASSTENEDASQEDVNGTASPTENNGNASSTENEDAKKPQK